MSLSDAMKKMKFDSRLKDFMLRHGEVTEKEIQDHLDKLEDVSKNSEKLSIFESDKNQEPSTH